MDEAITGQAPPADEAEMTVPSSSDPAPVDTVVVAPRRVRPRAALAGLRGAFAGISAIGVKELRGRMRGRRAFVILTVYLVLLAGFAWMSGLILERVHSGATASSAAFASAQVGRGIFAALLMLETFLVVALAPAFTAGAISLEREKQTLDMLATTPISSFAIVLGKLVSALTYLVILVVASIPLTAIVFVYGGVAPDDVVRGYLVLLATALGLGSIGLFFSALVRRTQAATIATYFAVIAITGGTFFMSYFWNTMTGVTDGTGGRAFGPLKGRPPEALQFLNPYFAQADILCSVDDGFGEWCERVAFIGAQAGNGIIFAPTPTQPGFGEKGVPTGRSDVVIDDRRGGRILPPRFGQAFELLGPDTGSGGGIGGFGVPRDGFWPKSAVSWIVVSGLLIVASIQLVAPTRRWHPALRRPRAVTSRRNPS